MTPEVSLFSSVYDFHFKVESGRVLGHRGVPLTTTRHGWWCLGLRPIDPLAPYILPDVIYDSDDPL